MVEDGSNLRGYIELGRMLHFLVQKKLGIDVARTRSRRSEKDRGQNWLV